MTDPHTLRLHLCGMCGNPCGILCGIKPLSRLTVRHVRHAPTQARACARPRAHPRTHARPCMPHMPHMAHNRAITPFHAAHVAARHAAQSRARVQTLTLASRKEGIVVEGRA